MRPFDSAIAATRHTGAAKPFVVSKEKGRRLAVVDRKDRRRAADVSRNQVFAVPLAAMEAVLT
jgi:hypothetical protein